MFKTVIELKRIGNNINQIAKQINMIPHEDNIKLLSSRTKRIFKYGIWNNQKLV